MLVSTIRPNRSCIGLLGTHAKGWVASSGFAALKPDSARMRSFLFAWLKMQSATDWLERCATASMYPAVSVADILKTPVPVLSDAAIDSIHNLIVGMEREVNECNTSYPEAETELMARLGWEKMARQAPELFYTRNLRDLLADARSDAEFFQPQHSRLRKLLIEGGAQIISSFSPRPIRGVTPTIEEEGEVLVLDSKAIRRQGVQPSIDRVSLSFYESKKTEKARVRKGDVLLNSTGRGTLSRCSYYHLRAVGKNDRVFAIRSAFRAFSVFLVHSFRPL